MCFFLLPQSKSLRLVIAQWFPFMGYGSVLMNATKRSKRSPEGHPSKRGEDDMYRSLCNALDYNNSLNRNKGDNVQSRGDIRKKEKPTQV